MVHYKDVPQWKMEQVVDRVSPIECSVSVYRYDRVQAVWVGAISAIDTTYLEEYIDLSELKLEGKLVCLEGGELLVVLRCPDEAVYAHVQEIMEELCAKC